VAIGGREDSENGPGEKGQHMHSVGKEEAREAYGEHVAESEFKRMCIGCTDANGLGVLMMEFVDMFIEIRELMEKSVGEAETHIFNYQAENQLPCQSTT